MSNLTKSNLVFGSESKIKEIEVKETDGIKRVFRLKLIHNDVAAEACGCRCISHCSCDCDRKGF